MFRFDRGPRCAKDCGEGSRATLVSLLGKEGGPGQLDPGRQVPWDRMKQLPGLRRGAAAEQGEKENAHDSVGALRASHFAAPIF